MSDSNVFGYYTYEGEFRALYSKSTLKIKAIIPLKVYCIWRRFTGSARLVFSLKG